MAKKIKCSACGGTKFLKPHSWWTGQHVICHPCFMVFYESGETNPAKVGLESMELQAAGEFPWIGKYASAEGAD